MRRTLESGLRVVAEHRPGAPMLAAQLWVAAGSADERGGEEAIAHLTEHLLLRGSRRFGPGEAARAVERAGGRLEACTDHDWTGVMVALPAAEQALALEVLLDVASSPCFDAAELVRESEVVCAELRRTADDPGRRLGQALLRQAFPGGGYARPVLGSEAAVRTATVERLEAFHQRWYRPENTVLSVVGDVDEDAMMHWLDGAWHCPQMPVPTRAARVGAEAPATVEAVIEVGGQRSVGLGWRLGRPTGRQAAIAEGLAAWLSPGEGQVLALQEAGLLVQSARAHDEAPTAVAARMRAALTAVAEGSGDDVQAHLALGRAVLRLRRKDEPVIGRARRLGLVELRGGGFEAETLEEVSVSQMQGLAQSLAQGAPAKVKPDVLAWVAAAPASPPPVRRAVGVRHERFTLSSGATLVVEEDPGAPLVAVQALWRGGQRAETLETAGGHALLAKTLEATLAPLERLGAVVSAQSGRHAVGVAMQAPAVGKWELALERLLDGLERPGLGDAGVAKQRTRQLAEVQARRAIPALTAFQLGEGAVLEGHPYALELLGSSASLEHWNAASLEGLLVPREGPAGLTLAVVGRVNAEAVAQRLEARWTQRGWPDRRPFAASPMPDRQVRSVHRPHPGEQRHVVLSFPGLSMYDRRRGALRLLSALLGGSAGRLYRTLRERHALAYCVDCLCFEGVDVGSVSLYAACQPAKVGETLKHLRAEVERCQVQPPSMEALEQARGRLEHTARLEREGTAARARHHANDACLEVEAPPACEDPRELVEVARACLDPSSAAEVVLGPPSSREPPSSGVPPSSPSLEHQWTGEHIGARGCEHDEEASPRARRQRANEVHEA